MAHERRGDEDDEVVVLHGGHSPEGAAASAGAGRGSGGLMPLGRAGGVRGTGGGAMEGKAGEEVRSSRDATREESDGETERREGPGGYMYSMRAGGGDTGAGGSAGAGDGGAGEGSGGGDGPGDLAGGG